MSRNESLARGAAVLAIAGLIVKISNLFVRVPLTRLIGTEGLGIYQMALPAFFAMYHLAAGGVPIAVQNLVAEYQAKERRAGAEQVLRLALRYSMLTGGAAACLLVMGAPLLARLLGEPRTYWALVAVAPAVPLFAMDAMYRSYMQGRKLMSPSAVASLVEQGTKIVATLALAIVVVPLGKAYAAGGAAAGITAGAVLSLVYMMASYHRLRREDGPSQSRPEPRSILVRRMVHLAWPVTLGSIMMPLLNVVDVGIVQRGFLKAGYGQSVATAMYGGLNGIAVQVVWFPMVITNALGNALVPVLAAARARHDEETVCDRALMGLRATGLICLPVVVGLAAFAYPIARLFGDPAAAVPLLYMAPAAYFGPLTWLMTAQLQALGKTGIPMRNFFVGLIIKLGLDAYLAPLRGIDIKGVALASVALFLISGYLNARALARELKRPLPWSWMLQGPLLASLIMGGVLVGIGGAALRTGTNGMLLSGLMLVSPFIYLGALILTRTITWLELSDMLGPLTIRLKRLLHWN